MTTKKKGGDDTVKEIADKAGVKTQQPVGPKMPGTKKLSALLATARSRKADVGEINGEYGAEVKALVDNDNLHKKAWASVVSSDRMEPEALADYFAHRDHYEEALGLRKRAGNVIKMDFGGEKPEKPMALPRGEAAE